MDLLSLIIVIAAIVIIVPLIIATIRFIIAMIALWAWLLIPIVGSAFLAIFLYEHLF